MSARVRRSLNSLERSASRVSARCASSPMGSREGMVAQPATRRSTREARTLLRSLGATLDAALAVLEVVHLLLDPVGGRIELQSLLPRGERIVVEPVLHERVTQVLVDHGIRLFGARDGPLELAQSLGVLPLLVVRPAEAVDEVAVVGLEVEGLADQLDRFLQVLTALGVHVADVVVGLCVLGIERDHAPEGADRVVEAGLLLEDHAQLEVEVLLLVVESQAL